MTKRNTSILVFNFIGVDINISGALPPNLPAGARAMLRQAGKRKIAYTLHFGLSHYPSPPQPSKTQLTNAADLVHRALAGGALFSIAIARFTFLKC